MSVHTVVIIGPDETVELGIAQDERIVLETDDARAPVIVEVTTGDEPVILDVITADLATALVEVGIPGPPGPPGPDGLPGGATLRLPVAAIVGGHRAVSIVNGAVRHADNGNPLQVQTLIGITLDAQVLIGEEVRVQTTGNVQEPSWNWLPGPIYLGVDGHLTQTPPAAGRAIKEIAFAMTAASLYVRVMPEIYTV